MKINWRKHCCFVGLVVLGKRLVREFWQEELTKNLVLAMMMVLLKVARTMENTKRDNYVDGAGYLSIAARLAGVTE